MTTGLMVFRWLSTWILRVAVLLGLVTIALVQDFTWGRNWRKSWRELRSPKKADTSATSAAPILLEWRSPWWAWQLLSLLTTTLLAPTFWMIGVLLLIDTRSDHPFFWPSVMAVVAVSNAVAIACVNQCHYRKPFTLRMPLILRYLGVAMSTGSVLFLLLGWITGFLPDVMAPMSGATGTSGSLPATMLWSALIALCFAILSFAHAGVLHAWLAFHDPE